jgi:GNAT superfamily N-acetyltransferase
MDANHAQPLMIGQRPVRLPAHRPRALAALQVADPKDEDVRAGRSVNLTSVAVILEEISDQNREAVLALCVAPGQEQFVSSVADSLAEAAEYPHAKPWYRAVFASDEPAGPVGFVMVSWNCEPKPPEIIGPWFLWKLLIDERYQGRGYGAAVVGHVAELVRAQGATELLTSYVPDDGGPAGFYQRLGFVPTGELDQNGEVIVRLALHSA